EYGGATGGVVIVVTKGGGNDFHGEEELHLRSSKLEPIPQQILLVSTSATQLQWYPNRYFQQNETNPTGNLSGPIWKNHLYFLVDYAPQILKFNRTLHFVADSSPCGPITAQYPCHAPV